jgi:exonuclease 1
MDVHSQRKRSQILQEEIQNFKIKQWQEKLKQREERKMQNHFISEASQVRRESLSLCPPPHSLATVTPEMVFQLIVELKALGIEYLVSPYESDAQLAFLSLSRYVDLIITEDSDALVYGCRCVLYKLDSNGCGEEIKRRSLGANEGLSFLNWSDEQFKLMCCLAGCDYAPKIRNVGIVTAHKIVNEHKTTRRIVEALRHSKYEGITDEYIQQVSEGSSRLILLCLTYVP